MKNKEKIYLFSCVLMVITLIIVLVVSSAFGQKAGTEESVSAGDQISSRFAEEKKQSETALDKLNRAEQDILIKGAGAGSTQVIVSRPSPASADGKGKDVVSFHRRLVDAGKTEAVLDQQQERFINEILRLKRRIKTLEGKRPIEPDLDFEKREEELKWEISREHRRVEKLERELEAYRAEDREKSKSERQERLFKTTIIQERARTEKLRKTVSRLEEELASARQNIKGSTHLKERCVAAQRSAEQLELQLASKNSVQTDNGFLRSEIARLKSELGEREQDVVSLKRQLSKTIEDTKVCRLSVDEKKELLSKLPKLEQDLAQLKSEASEKAKAVESCSLELERNKKIASKARDLEKELLVSKNELLMKDTEIKLLGKTKVSKISGKRQVRATAGSRLREESKKTRARLSAKKTESSPPVLADVMILEVKGEKVNLRSGPGREHSPIMQVSKGARLTVEAQQGDWYRIFTPTGSRAFVRKDVVRIVDQGLAGAATVANNSGTALQKPALRAGKEEKALVPFGRVKLAGSSSDLETIAFERLRALSERKKRNQ